MLVQYTPTSSLDADTRARLAAAASGLMCTAEAAQGYLVFEGKYFSILEVRALTPRPPLQNLMEG
jgi:hypothetical protein